MQILQERKIVKNSRKQTDQSRAVALVINQFTVPRSQGGITRHVDLFGNLEQWDAIYIAGSRNYNTQESYTTDEPGFKSVWVPRSDGTPLSRFKSWIAFCLQALLQGVGMKRVDVVYGSSPHLLAPVVAWMVARLRGVPYILEVRDLWPEMFVTTGVLDEKSRTYALLKRLERFISLRADAIVTVAVGWEDHFAQLGVDRSKIVAIPNGSKSVEIPDSQERESLRIKHNVVGTTAIYAGAHGFANGLDALLDAASHIRHINFILVGSGQEKDQLVKRARAEAITNIEFRPPMNKDELLELLTICDIGIHSLRPYETLRKGMSPNKIYDYMAAGLAVVSNAGDASIEILGQQSERGVAVESDDLVAGVHRVLHMESEERNRMRMNARRAIDESFSLRTSSEKLEKLLDNVSSIATNIDRRGRNRTVLEAQQNRKFDA